jgi:HlyD family secretion protein
MLGHLHLTDRVLPQKWWRQRWVFGIGAVAALAVLLITLLELQGTAHRARVASSQITFSRAAPGVFHDYVPLRAHIAPMSIVYLDAQAGGRVEKVLVQAGDRVEQGQLLLELSNSQWQLDVLEREARLVESVSQLESYQTQLEQNRISNQRALALVDYDIVRLRRSLARRSALTANALEPAEKLDLIKDELDYDLKIQPLQDESNRRQEQLRVEQIPQIREQLLSLQQDLAMTHGQLDKLALRAPIAGHLTALAADVGQSRTLGERFGEITPDNGFKVTASVDEYYLGKVQPAQRATVVVRNQPFDLQVSRIFPQVKNGLFTVDFHFLGKAPADLTPGETAEGKLTLGADHEALLVANGPFLDQTGGDWAFIVSADGTHADRRRISLGRRNSLQVEVLGGLKAGETMVTSDYQSFMNLDRLELAH